MTNFEYIMQNLTPEKFIEIIDKDSPDCELCSCFADVCEKHPGTCDEVRVQWLKEEKDMEKDFERNKLYEDISLDDIELEFGTTAPESSMPPKLEKYQRDMIMFLAHDLMELEGVFKDCSSCYCKQYCDRTPHLGCRETRYEFLATKAMDMTPL